VRKHLKGKYRDKGKFKANMYSVALYYLLRDVMEDIDEIVMEVEYEGWMDDIINTTCNWIRDVYGGEAYADQFTIQPRQPHFKPDILANKVRKEEVEADRQLNFSDFDERL
jgi:hypothetical protein